jgi:hypothetical protein
LTERNILTGNFWREAMRKNPALLMNTTLRKKLWEPVLFQGCPDWQCSVNQVKIIGDLSKRTFAELDYLFAIFASNGSTRFTLEVSRESLERWFQSVEKRSVGAAEKYEQKMRRHFAKYKNVFTEGYSLPGAPTPQLRLLYDSAAKSEHRPTRPCGCGFSGGEYHWRPWPLNNVSYA